MITLPSSVTPYSAGTLAMSRDRLWTDEHIESPHILECDHAGNILRKIDKPNPPGTVLTGLRWTAEHLLIWTARTFYTGDHFEPTCGAIPSRAGDPRKPWTYKGHHLKHPATYRSGGTIGSPIGNLQGFGGYYSGSDVNPSWGPSLIAPDGRMLLGYPEWWRCFRQHDFKRSNDWPAFDPNRWTAADTIGGNAGAGGAVLHNGRVYFFVKRGVGKVWYDSPRAAVLADGYRYSLYSYAWSELLKPGNPWRHVPVISEWPYEVRGVAKVGNDVFGFCPGDRPEIRKLFS
jgi:hypothetical protein